MGNETQVSKVEKRSKKKIFFGTAIGYVHLILSVVAGMVYTPWIINTIGKSGYGLYTMSNTLISLFLLDFGLSATTNSFLAKYRASGDKESEERFIATVTKLYLIIDAVLFAVFVILYFNIENIYSIPFLTEQGKGLKPNEVASFKTVFLVTASFSLISFPCTIFSGILQSYEEFGWVKIIDVINKILFIALSATALLIDWKTLGITNPDMKLFMLVVANAAAGLICLVLKFIVSKKKTHARADFKWKAPKGYMKSILTYAGWAAVYSLTARLVFNAASPILSMVANANESAHFAVSASLEGYVYTFGAVMSGFFMPKLSRMLAGENKEENQRNIDKLAVKMAKLQLAILLLVEIGYACVGQEFIFIWLGRGELLDGETVEEAARAVADYIPSAYWGTMAMIGYQLVFVPELVYNTEMYQIGKVKHLALAAIIKAILNLGLCFLFGYLWGALGACLSITASRLFEIVTVNYFYRKDIGVNLKEFFKKTYLPAIPAALISLAVGLTLHFVLFGFDVSGDYIANRIADVSFMGEWAIKLVIEVVAIIAAYVIPCWFISLNKEDRAGFKSLFKRAR